MGKRNKNISTKLNNISKYEKYSIYDAYIIQLDELKEYNFSITIEGTIGDFIDIGSSFFQDNMGNYYVGRECYIYGFLKRGFIEKNCFTSNNYFPSLKIFDDINIDTKVKSISYGTICITLPSEINELFF